MHPAAGQGDACVALLRVAFLMRWQALASPRREGVPPSIAPQGAQNTRYTTRMRALAGAMEGGTPSLQKTATLEANIRSLVSYGAAS